MSNSRTSIRHGLTASGLSLSNTCRIVHQAAIPDQIPFPKDIPDLSMRQLLPSGDKALRGQLGVIEFTEHYRLPRHIHIAKDREGRERLISERIFVSAGVALVELSGEIYIIAPNTLVDIAAGVPHAWTGCPPGVVLPDGTLSTGSFLMLYQYEHETAFYPTDRTTTFQNVEEYNASKYSGDLNSIRFPALTKEAVVEQGRLIWATNLARAAF
ncbi:hypothetical protein M409DRAFT_61704 [Zasmidium cellare ATCC 36951]|uniref:Uncharacterized protein n=1 Tax=Zasmidium cellare ATCC 36951 TaxID=1080233 RepID=A0A6A6BUH3_ZASCE|nr:uncharacterized protein M409DRAFT_61704 [Zasmidium cellare ATCC 36951]KAF2158391.1 hypothetical protein M409DRAFT_61704 [Zasmidium cellare ATCC 36951]